jgi:SprT protein
VFAAPSVRAFRQIAAACIWERQRVDPMPPSTNSMKSPTDLLTSIGQWSPLWNTPGLEHRTRVEFSSRMTRALGLCYLDRGLIRISASVTTGPPELLLEVLCHEAAHLAADELHGRRIRPHGPEWRSLMTAAGYQPRARMPFEPPAHRPGDKQGTQWPYEHRCPICQTTRRARTSVRRWRCRQCVETGLDGELAITSVPRKQRGTD